MSRRSDIKTTDYWFKGEDKVFQFTIQDSAGAAVDITGWTLSWAIATARGTAPALTVAGAITDAANGVCTVTIADTDTDGLTAQTYEYDLKRTDAGSEAILAHGRAVLQEPVIA